MEGGSKRFNISNKLFYTIVFVIALVLIGVGVYAYGTSSPTTFGHSTNEIAAPSGCSSGQVLSWTGSSWTCTDTGVSGLEVVTLDTCNGEVSCPSGKVVVGGGCLMSSNNAADGDTYFYNDAPAKSSILASSPYDQWQCKSTGGATACTIYAICINA